MSDGAKGWSIEDKYLLLVQIIEQLTQGDGRAKINFKDIHMPSRSEKAISLQWYKIKKDAAKMAADMVGNKTPLTPTSAAAVKTPNTGRKTRGSQASKRKAAPALGSMGEEPLFDEDDDFNHTPTKKAKIKGRPTKKQPKQKQEAEFNGPEEPQIKLETDINEFIKDDEDQEVTFPYGSMVYF